MTDEAPKKPDEPHIIKWNQHGSLWYLCTFTEKDPVVFTWTSKHNKAKRFVSGEIALVFATTRVGSREGVDIQSVIGNEYWYGYGGGF